MIIKTVIIYFNIFALFLQSAIAEYIFLNLLF